MKTVIFGVFAHPDDEAFGPSGYLIKSAKTDSDVFLILVTDGEGGQNSHSVEDLAKNRLSEWEQSAQIIGVKHKTALHFKDGALCNNLYFDFAQKLQDFVVRTLNSYDEQLEIEFVTFENSGVSGHVDHVFVSLVCTYVYECLKSRGISHHKLGKLKYFCLPSEFVPKPNCEWVYMPKGKNRNQVDEIVDVSEFIETKLEAMRAHKSQAEDYGRILQMMQTSDEVWAKEYFVHHK